MPGLRLGAESVLQRMGAARTRSSELHVHFTRAADAANLAVMADTNEAAAEFAHEAAETSDVVEKDVAALRMAVSNGAHRCGRGETA